MSTVVDSWSVLRDRRYVARLLIAMTVAVAVVLALTWFMHMLIETGQQRLEEVDKVRQLEFVRVKRSETSDRKQRLPQRPLAAPAPPAPASPAATDNASGDALLVGVSELPVSIGKDLLGAGLGLAFSNAEYLPIVKVAPVYPQAALRRRLEGGCTVTYNVTTTGSVKDVQVMQCDYEEFHRPSLEAALKFKYKPRLVDGKPVGVTGVSNRFIFEIVQDEDTPKNK